jgi:hypothetical protein
MSAIINPLGPSGSSLGCYGDSTGSLTVQVSSGTSPYAYQWVGPASINDPYNDSIFNLIAGTYSVTVTDGNGCIVNTNQQLTIPLPLLYTLFSTMSTTCLGACDGDLALSIQGGTPPFTAHLLNNQNGLSSPYSVNSSSLVTGV